MEGVVTVSTAQDIVAVAGDQAVIAVTAVHRSRYTTDEARQKSRLYVFQAPQRHRYDSISLESW
jgi:hypothetical protein